MIGSEGFATGASFGLGAGLGAVDCRNMLAQVLGTGTVSELVLGLGTETGAAGVGSGEGAASAGAASVVQAESVASSAVLVLFHSEDSSVGTDSSLLRLPLVVA